MEVHHATELPADKPGQAYCLVSALEAGFCELPLDYILDTAQPGSRANLPCLAFLLRHSKTPNTKLLFDLGIRKDHEHLPPAYLARIRHMTFKLHVPFDAADALANGGLAPPDISHVCFSHLHFDHVGDPAPYTRATFLVGAAARPLVEAGAGYPHDPTSLFDSGLLPPNRTRWLDPAAWPPLGPFPHALDLFGDGSLYVVDAGAGHMPGHLNVLARTSDDGGWVYLAGDAAHDRRLLSGEARIAEHGVFGCAHRDAGEAGVHMARIRRLAETYPRVRVMLAHDVPWYELARESGKGFWPDTIDSL